MEFWSGIFCKLARCGYTLRVTSQASFRKGVLAFEKGVLAFQKGVLAFEKEVLAFETEF
jgi:hypothetical protein